jgi:dihydroorotate dehydrogenase electron transfer subunit
VTAAVPDLAVRLVPLPVAGPLSPRVPVPLLLDAPVLANVPVARDYLRITLQAPGVAAVAHPGQFLMMTIAREDEPAPVLPRPMAIYGIDRSAGTVDVVYRTVGTGTHRMATWQAGEPMTIVGPLGRGFTIPPGATSILLLGRGIGNCSLTTIVPEAVGRGIRVTVVVSARDPDSLVGGDTCREWGAADVHEVVDSDGSSDPGRVVEQLGSTAAAHDAYYVCGSRRLLELAARLAHDAGRGGPADHAEVQVSLEAHMACGLGYCHGCAAGRPGLPAETPLVCRDGPVFRWARSVREGAG